MSEYDEYDCCMIYTLVFVALIHIFLGNHNEIASDRLSDRNMNPCIDELGHSKQVNSYINNQVD